MDRTTYNSILVSFWKTVEQRGIMSSTDLADGVSLAGAAVLTGQARVYRLCIWSVCICCCWTIKTLPKQTLWGKKKNKLFNVFCAKESNVAGSTIFSPYMPKKKTPRLFFLCKENSISILWVCMYVIYILCAEEKCSVKIFFFPEPTCGSLRPLESESEVSLYWEEAISTSVDALLRFFRGLQASEISLAPTGTQIK